MSFHQCFICTFLVLSIGFGLANAQLLQSLPKKTVSHPTIYVDPSGSANFSTIQSAIDSIPPNNRNWICVYINAGLYREQVIIPSNKPFIYLKGKGKGKTTIVWGAHESISTSATFISQANNIVAKSITFKNSYNNPPTNPNPVKAAVAAMIAGDKSAFYRCGFLGFQDTLWDVKGRHYFKLCTIQGAVDFIFGAGQSIYERCSISVIAGGLKGVAGFITAQAREEANDASGFVFKDCNVMGNGQAYLGRAWRGYARVLFYNSSLSDIIVPQGWFAWGYTGREHQLTFAEHDCNGLGSNTSKRVKWEKKLSVKMVSWLTSIAFIDNEGWLRSLPFNMLP